MPFGNFRQGINVSESALFQPEDSAYPLWDPETADAKKLGGSMDFDWLPDEKNRLGRWVLHGAGPDTDYEAAEGVPLHAYNPSNGVRSGGDITRFGP